MMNEARPYASLSSGLLARKGAAKPAMRPQGFGNFGAGLEDLGWNDMGQAEQVGPAFAAEAPKHVPSSISALTPAPRPAGKPDMEEAASPEPTVVEQQRTIAQNFGEVEEAPAVPAVKPRPAEVVKLPRSGRSSGGRKAAFTLRLDPGRHLRLRLACAVTGRSAQQIVSGALDQVLESLPEVEALAERAAGGRRS